MSIMYAYIANLTGNLFHSRQDYIKSKMPISPMAYWISWCYVFLNLLLGVYFFSTTNTVLQARVLVAGFITLDVWGILFVGIGVALMIALLKGAWHVLWYAMFAGLAVKYFWAIVLIFVAMHIGVTRALGSIAIWFTLAAIQTIVVIYLFPKEAAITNVGKDLH